MELSVVEEIVLNRIEQLSDSIDSLVKMYRDKGITTTVNSIQDHAEEISCLIDILTEYKSEKYRTEQKEKEKEDDLK